MMQQGRWQQFGVVSLAALCLAGGQGCLSFVHSLDLPPKEQIAQAEMIPVPCRNQVHIFLIHGLDPLDLANLSGLTEYIQQLGYIKTHFGQVYHLWEFKKEMRRIHKHEPQARFVVVGFSLGSNVARELANAVKEDGILIDSLIYLDGCALDKAPRNHPENVVHVVNVTSVGYMGNEMMDGADNIHCNNVWHFGSPTHDQTRELLAHELAAAALRVPYVEKAPPLSPELEDEIPLPRRLKPDERRKMSSQLPSEWSFLTSRTAAADPPLPALAQPRESPNAHRVPFAIGP